METGLQKIMFIKNCTEALEFKALRFITYFVMKQYFLKEAFDRRPLLQG